MEDNVVEVCVRITRKSGRSTIWGVRPGEANRINAISQVNMNRDAGMAALREDAAFLRQTGFTVTIDLE